MSNCSSHKGEPRDPAAALEEALAQTAAGSLARAKQSSENACALYMDLADAQGELVKLFGKPCTAQGG